MREVGRLLSGSRISGRERPILTPQFKQGTTCFDATLAECVVDAALAKSINDDDSGSD
jgi:hypothetical protein